MDDTTKPDGFPFALGRKPDTIDPRDKLFSVVKPRALAASLPKSIDQRRNHYSIQDQGSIGSCVGHGVVGAFRKALKKKGLPDHIGSRLATYYFAREIEGTTAQDVGCMIRDGMKAASKRGVLEEVLWPYLENRYDELPPEEARASGLKHMGLEYRRVDSTSRLDCKAAIAQHGNLVIGIAVYPSFASPHASGLIPMPKPGEQLMGYHCVDTAGYSPTSLLIANSWGSGWGRNGLARLPWAFIEDIDQCSDFWSWVQIS